MELVSFEVKNFRSVNNSGKIEVSKLTALVGRNESGKTNLLLALSSLNPPGGMKSLVSIKDFPRGRRLSECTETTGVLTTHWKLAPSETAKLSEALGGDQTITEVDIGRFYGAKRWVDLKGLKQPTLARIMHHSASFIFSARSAHGSSPIR